jgi:hypothetical protein
MQRLTPTMALLLSEINFSPLFENSQIRNIRWLSKSVVQAPDQDEIMRTTDVLSTYISLRLRPCACAARVNRNSARAGRNDLDLRIEIKIPERLTAKGAPCTKNGAGGAICAVGGGVNKKQQ